jgi:hypothetical protein
LLFIEKYREELILPDKKNFLNSLFTVWYNTSYGEATAKHALTSWGRVSTAIKLLVGITASGSAIAALSFWKEQQMYWMVLVGTAAIASWIDSGLSPATRIKNWSSAKTGFAVIRNSLEILRTKMNLQSGDDVEANLVEELLNLQTSYGKLDAEIPNSDIFLTKTKEMEIQTSLLNPNNKTAFKTEIENVVQKKNTINTGG